ncbi:16S rRNA (guanine(527)-N(7))-methyltransferase RsmG [Sphingomonas sp. CL5.1]|uniref:16S rRNA (guanine(527)-N(7))-methyltransferase RsmG n=1 Tax=Sphingomonas sp. CL5.1 TaxID=2653203 RepID=UPI0015816562|nr:16S rRNA (guanine(527)-N(7))-methyltransferase RsmG [Sphingomonas sp. CL5.1]QKR99104.1 16S rRNA (guanine(527)-N(7))-methyltransferase RsmG [Sphingomonas sp. CL5.1]
MTEADARAWIEQRFGQEATARVAHFADQVARESEYQNLIARSTLDSIWSRHILDSAQLIPLAGKVDAATRWLDIGSGAGFPGVVVALLTPAQVTLVEPRRRRVDFLSETLTNTPNATVLLAKVEAISVEPQQIISARAVAPVLELLRATRHLADISTRYILPRGRSAHAELESARRGWHGLFHVEPSITDAESGILIAEKVRIR